MTSERLRNKVQIKGERSPINERKEETSSGANNKGFPDLLPLEVDLLI